MHDYDIIVIGGGITGAGIARLGAENNLKTLLIDINDFAYGTSSKSSKLIHGGLRYLQQFQFRLSRESCLERNLLMQSNPGFIRPIPFYFPLNQSLSHSRYYYQLGFFLYDMLSGFKNYGSYKYLNKYETLSEITQLKADQIKGSFRYYDAAVDDARLVIETIKAAHKLGADVYNHVTNFQFIKRNQNLLGVSFFKKQREYRFTAKKIINATGIKSDQVRKLADGLDHNNLITSSGIHLFFKKSLFPFDGNITLESIRDGRPVFIMDWDPFKVIGTTDSKCSTESYTGQIKQDEINYILETVNHYFSEHITVNDIIAMQSGIRPMVSAKNKAESTKDISREEAIFEDKNGLISIAGGKLTTYRLMAYKLLKKYFPNIEQRNSHYIFNSQYDMRDIPTVTKNSNFQKILIWTYCLHLKNIFTGNSNFNESDIIKKTFKYAVENEFCESISDYMFRRFRLAIWSADHGKGYKDILIKSASEYLGVEEKQAQIMYQSYLDEIALQEKIC